jgi:hypothetical protein
MPASFESARDQPKKLDIEQVEDGHGEKQGTEERIVLTEEDVSWTRPGTNHTDVLGPQDPS